MKLQKGNFLIKNINDLKKIDTSLDGIKRVIDLEYMGRYEYEGNAIPVSRMYIEYYKDKYLFYPTQIFSKNNEQLYLYANSDVINEKIKDNPNFISSLVEYNIDRNFSLWEYINHFPEECLYDFWWSIGGDYYIFFGEEKKDIINYFINSCFERDGKKEGIQRKLRRAGYKI